MSSLAIGCTPPVAHQGLEVADSAGVRIVVVQDSLSEEHFPPLLLLERVDTIGVGMGDDSSLFSYILGAVLTPDGIQIADRLSREIRRFDGGGRFLASVGGEGEGPGEFESLSWIQQGQDGLLFAWDGSASRLTRIAIGDSGLSFLSSRELRVVPWEAQLMGVVGADRLLLVGAGSDRPPPVPGKINGGEMMVGSASEETLPEMHRLATVPSRPAYLSNDSRAVPVPFTVLPDYAYAAGVESVWFGNGGDGEIRKVDLDGQVAVILRLPSAGSVTDEDIERFVEADLGYYQEDERPGRRRLLNEIPLPNELPAFDRLELDNGQRLWVRGYPSASSPLTPWYVFDRHSCPVGQVRLPAGVRILAINHRRIAARIQDDLGVHRVLIYRLAEEFETGEPKDEC